MKKYLSVLLITTVLLGLSACDSDDDDGRSSGDSADTEYTVTFTAGTSAVTFSKGYTDYQNTPCAEFAGDGNLYGLALETGVSSENGLEGASFSFTLPSKEPGIYTGDMNNCSIKYSNGSVDYVAGTFAGGYTAGSLTIELSSCGEPGEAVKGTFTAICMNQGDDEDTIAITGGSFTLLRVEGLVDR